MFFEDAQQLTMRVMMTAIDNQRGNWLTQVYLENGINGNVLC